MNNIATLEKMRELRLFGMEKTFSGILDAGEPGTLTGNELIAQLVDAEGEERDFRKTTRLTKVAAFRSQAAFHDIDFRTERGLEKTALLRLADCAWVSRGKTIIISGPTGVGKSFLAQALGMQACQCGFRTLYYNCSKLFPLLKLKREENTYHRLIARIARTHVLILDDFGLLALDTQDRLALMEIVEDRYGRAGTVIATQIPVTKWFEVIGDPTIADALCDRLVPQAERIKLTGKSLRTVKADGKQDDT